jgi:hypothetical protein
MRFSGEICDFIRESRWWENSIQQSMEHIDQFIEPVSPPLGETGHSLLTSGERSRPAYSGVENTHSG